MTYIIVACVLVALFLIWIAIRTFQNDRPLLYVLVPVVLTFSVYSGHAVNSMLGYATRDLSDLRVEFAYVAHLGEDPVFLLAIPSGSPEPRLYAIPGNTLSEEERRGMTEAGEKSKQSVQQMGQFAEGEFVFHDFDVDRLPPKGD